MPTKTFQATCCTDKRVLVTVYVEKPRRSVSNHHRTIKKDVLIQHKHGGAGKSYSRRAELLQYSQRLRESARVRVRSSPPLQTNPVSSNHHQPSNKIMAVKRKPKYSETPGCFGKWGIMLPSFLRSTPTSSNNKKMKRLQMQKNWRLILSKPFAMLHRHG